MTSPNCKGRETGLVLQSFYALTPNILDPKQHQQENYLVSLYVDTTE
jgi:hypothetical protein